ncbi:unnamed protein product [Trichobilharzia regenti]|nr:unnamed protein product [Trichobilharzia regenti]
MTSTTTTTTDACKQDEKSSSNKNDTLTNMTKSATEYLNFTGVVQSLMPFQMIAYPDLINASGSPEHEPYYTSDEMFLSCTDGKLFIVCLFVVLSVYPRVFFIVTCEKFVLDDVIHDLRFPLVKSGKQVL